MTMKTFRRTMLASAATMAAMALAGAVLFRYWINPIAEQPREKPKPAGLVDVQPLLAAQRLAGMATSPQEQEFAQNALRTADHEVDLAFAAALHNATEHTQ